MKTSLSPFYQSKITSACLSSHIFCGVNRVLFAGSEPPVVWNDVISVYMTSYLFVYYLSCYRVSEFDWEKYQQSSTAPVIIQSKRSAGWWPHFANHTDNVEANSGLLISVLESMLVVLVSCGLTGTHSKRPGRGSSLTGSKLYLHKPDVTVSMKQKPGLASALRICQSKRKMRISNLSMNRL